MNGFSLTGHRYTVCLYEHCADLGDEVPKPIGIDDPNKVRLHKAFYAQFGPVICPYHPGWGCYH